MQIITAQTIIKPV